MGRGLEFGRQAGKRLAAFSAAVAVATSAVGGPVAAQQKEISDRSVSILMEYAFAILPSPTYTDTQTGKVIPVDKSKPDLFKIPMDTAREVVRVGRLSAFAQICELQDEQARNFSALMKRETDKKKWTDQQLLYIQWLHLFTVMFMTGGVKIEQDDGGGQKRIVELDQKKEAKKAESCNDAERKRVLDQILAYVGSTPIGDTTTGSTTAPAAAPAPAPAQKK
jgi:hypothetical protein